MRLYFVRGELNGRVAERSQRFNYLALVSGESLWRCDSRSCLECLQRPPNVLVSHPMSTPEFVITPGYGDRQRKLYHDSQAVKVGDRVETSGQGGWNDDWQFPESVVDEIAEAFRNVERTLAAAGVNWAHVVHVNS